MTALLWGRRIVGAASLLALGLLAAPVGLAQSATSGFTGGWLQDLPAAIGGPVPKLVLRVTMTDRMLAVEEHVGDSELRQPPRSYRLDPQVVDRGVAEFTGRTFRWLAADRLELHDFAISPQGAKSAVTAVWELRDGGRQLRIRRTLRSVDDLSKKPEDRFSTYRRVQP